MGLTDFRTTGRETSATPRRETGTGITRFQVAPQATPASKTKTSEGLRQLAEEKGLGKEAERVLKGKGEDPKEIFSGGIIQDVFDTLNLFQHGVTGTLKGKGFAEGVRTRQSFSDKDALGEFGLPGVIGGIALDIAVDPLTYIPPLAIAKRLPLAGKIATKVQKSFTKTQLGQTLGRAFIYRFGQDPIYKEIAERGTKNIAIGNRNLLDLARPLTKLNAVDQKRIADARKAGALDELPQELLESARPVFTELDALGKKAVEAGLLKKETYDENLGKYIARLYRKHEAPLDVLGKTKQFLFDTKPLRIDASRFKKRTDIPEDVREAMGEILEVGYPTAKSLMQINTAIERANFFKQVNKVWAKDTVEIGFEKLPDTKTLGELSGKAVPKAIFDDVQEIIRNPEGLEKLGNKIMGTFKFSKVILNPATHARNIMSNFVLNNFEGLNPARLDIYAKAAKSIIKKDEIYQEAKNAGLGLDTFASQELKGFLDAPEVAKLGSRVKGALNKIADLYQKEEEFAKMAQYTFQKGKGLSPDEAYKIAERATFNYAQVTPFIRRLRESIFGYPFITFTAKVTPQVAKTLAKKPTKISNIGKIKIAIENQADLPELKRERASEPSWIRDAFYVKLPMKDEHGRSAYFDLSYILPFGDLVSGQFFERGIKRETGLPEGAPEALIKKLPFINLVREIGKNQDFFGNKIWRESDSNPKQLTDLFRHLTKTIAPPLIADQIPGGIRRGGDRRKPAIQRALEVEKGGIEAGGLQTRDLSQEMLRLVGLKINPVDIGLQEKFAEFEKRRALETLLGERGELREFSTVFVPKDK